MILPAWIAVALAALPAVLFLSNLPLYRRLGRPTPATAPAPASLPAISVLIPARNEAATIQSALESVLHAAGSAPLEVVVLDDHSTDATASLVRSASDRDPRIRLIQGQPLAEGWCGKQHACWQLANEARHDLLLFLDADVRLLPDALERLVRHMQQHPQIDLLSGVPHQQTVGLLERLLLPLIHFVLLGFLPMLAARRSRWPAFAAGCGQLFLARRTPYLASGGHRTIRTSLHDGVTLPRAFRNAGHFTDLFDATDIATCRMYRSASEVWQGLAKNATEGMASPAAIVPWSILLLGGQVLPWIVAGVASMGTDAFRLGILAILLSYLPRILATLRFHQSALGALLHPVGILVLMAIQWVALFRQWRGQPMEWRGRSYPPSSTPIGHPPAP
ncbi:MAG: glycosyltransferase [Verrucomicrobiae bacterium]|nr:glycosyltransferase [Verrucomicrobiae bacterium]